MANLLELEGVSKVYTRGLINAQSTVALQPILDHAQGGRADDPDRRRRKRQRQDDAWRCCCSASSSRRPGGSSIAARASRRSDGEEKLAFRREVQAVFQDPFAVFNPFYTVDHLLTVPIKKFKLAKNATEARAKMNEALRAVGLRPEDVLGRFPHQVSGGQRQRINVARALLLKPRLLIADEPVSMVDASLRASILETLRNLQRDHGVSIIYITHDLTTAFHIAKSIVVLYRGAVMEAGDVDTVIKSPQHPYTKLLVDSIPWPNLDRRWGEQPVKAREAGDRGTGCRFLARCPSAMERCATQPPIYELDGSHGASCYLYADKPEIANERLTELLPA